jgi:hypothetical protein
MFAVSERFVLSERVYDGHVFDGELRFWVVRTNSMFDLGRSRVCNLSDGLLLSVGDWAKNHMSDRKLLPRREQPERRCVRHRQVLWDTRFIGSGALPDWTLLSEPEYQNGV